MNLHPFPFSIVNLAKYLYLVLLRSKPSTCHRFISSRQHVILSLRHRIKRYIFSTKGVSGPYRVELFLKALLAGLTKWLNRWTFLKVQVTQKELTHVNTATNWDPRLQDASMRHVSCRGQTLRQSSRFLNKTMMPILSKVRQYTAEELDLALISDKCFEKLQKSVGIYKLVTLVPLLVGLRNHKFYHTVFHSYLFSYPFAYELT